MMTLTDTPKRLSDVGLAVHLRAKVAAYKLRENSPVSTNTVDLMERAAAAIERLSAPPSQGKVERARELLAEACTAEHLPLLAAWLRKGSVIEKPIAVAALRAITQALCESEAITACSNQRFDTVTESSAQGMDGACCEAMREAAAKIAEGEVIHHRYRTWPWWGDGNRDKQDALVQFCDLCAKAIRALKSKQPSDTGAGK